MWVLWCFTASRISSHYKPHENLCQVPYCALLSGLAHQVFDYPVSRIRPAYLARQPSIQRGRAKEKFVLIPAPLYIKAITINTAAHCVTTADSVTTLAHTHTQYNLACTYTFCQCLDANKPCPSNLGTSAKVSSIVP